MDLPERFQEPTSAQECHGAIACAIAGRLPAFDLGRALVEGGDDHVVARIVHELTVCAGHAPLARSVARETHLAAI